MKSSILWTPPYLGYCILFFDDMAPSIILKNQCLLKVNLNPRVVLTLAFNIHFPAIQMHDVQPHHMALERVHTTELQVLMGMSRDRLEGCSEPEADMYRTTVPTRGRGSLPPLTQLLIHVLWVLRFSDIVCTFKQYYINFGRSLLRTPVLQWDEWLGKWQPSSVSHLHLTWCVCPTHLSAARAGH